jgi:hypothetical protein
MPTGAMRGVPVLSTSIRLGSTNINRPRRGEAALRFLGAIVIALILFSAWINFRVTPSTRNAILNVDELISHDSDESKTSDDDFQPVTPFEVTEADGTVKRILPDGFDHDAYISKLNAKQKQLCGDLCKFDTNSWKRKRAKHITVEYLQSNVIKKRVDCQSLFSVRAEEVFDTQGLTYPPLQSLPAPLEDDCTLSGLMKLQKHYFTTPSIKVATYHTNWGKDYIDDIVRRLLQGKDVYGGYGVNATRGLFNFIRSRTKIRDLNVLVVGSEKPWVEAICIAAGARSVTTLEYRAIQTDHPKIRTLVPEQFNDLFRKGQLPEFDVAVTYSSLEHSGLGRYGDGFNCYGDIISTARLSCVVKRGGHLVLGLPARENGFHDILWYNEARNYGSIRWPFILTNWLAIDYMAEGKIWYHGVVYAVNART